MKKKTGLKSKPKKAKRKSAKPPVKPHKVITIKAPVKAPVAVLIKLHPEHPGSAGATQAQSDAYYKIKRYH